MARRKEHASSEERKPKGMDVLNIRGINLWQDTVKVLGKLGV